MKIATFGCSWTHGITEVDNRYSWPYALSKLKPDWEIYNYAIEGTSLSLHTFLLDDLLRNNSFDKIIFQITTPGRLSYTPNEEYDLSSMMRKNTDNYFSMDTSGGFFRKRVITNCPGHMKLSSSHPFWKYPGKYEFAKRYYSSMSKNIIRTEYKALIYYVMSKADFVFIHNEDILNLGTCPIILEELTEEQKKDFVADEGSHFNTQGCDWQANWILEKL